ncbi:helix-turn-helix domain-containing protein [Burkholderia multivorans]|nr:helix-turn-helix domain-containing protein [Burkholderia multivorans]QET42057.1 helix-turn-helix domain-containing protein [Burkholderia multivorans]
MQMSKYLTPAEVAARYEGQISVRTLANWRWAGTGPKFTRIGGKILYDLQRLIEWEERRTVSSTSDYR